MATTRDLLVSGRWSILSYIIVIAIFGAFIAVLDLVGVIQTSFLVEFWPTAYAPLGTTLTLTVASFLLGFVGAVPLGLVRAYGAGILRRKRRKGAPVLNKASMRKAGMTPLYGLGTAYVSAIRGTPFLVQTYFVFYLFLVVAPKFVLFGVDFYFWAGLVALTLNTIGYQAEVFRAGFQSVGQGQIEAARAIGLRGWQVFAHITLPQAIRLILLPLTNEFISLLKASTIVSYIAVYEIFHWSEDMGQTYGHPIEGFLMISMFYLLINVPLSRIVTYVEQKKRIPGLGTPMREEKGPQATL